MKIIDGNRYVTVYEMAKVLGTCRTDLYRKMRKSNGKFRHIIHKGPLNNHIYFNKTLLQEIIKF